jgi:hypothetical protein
MEAIQVTMRSSEVAKHAKWLVAALALLIVWALPASAGPTLFSANMSQAGGIVATSALYQTSTGPTAGAPAVALNTAGGNVQFPALAFDRLTPGYTFSLPPVYPYIWANKQQQNRAGTLANSYFTPSVIVTVNSTNSVDPYLDVTPRQGWMRFNPGSKGFGGVVEFPQVKNYVFDIQTSLGILKAACTEGQTVDQFAAIGFSLSKRNNMMEVCRTYPAGSPQYQYTAAAVEAGGPWLTGMVTVFDGGNAGPNITTTTQTGGDARSAFDTGALSLVTPRLQMVYQGDGQELGHDSLINLRDGFAVIHGLEITFLPEPSHLVMLFAGLAGLVGLRRRSA